MNLEQLYILIRRFEGCRLMPYYCPAGVLTCGWGSTGPDIFPGRPWTQEYADRRMALDAIRFARATSAYCPGLDDVKFCALADFAYNLGISRLKTSTLRRRVNAKDWTRAGDELRKWVNGGGRRLPGLVARREAERLLLLK